MQEFKARTFPPNTAARRTNIAAFNITKEVNLGAQNFLNKQNTRAGQGTNLQSSTRGTKEICFDTLRFYELFQAVGDEGKGDIYY